jgi:hypothetical protein
MWDATVTETLWNDEDFSILDSDGAPQEWAEAFVRAQPRAVAGTVEGFSWDPDSLRFELTVSQGRAGVSEAWIPLGQLGPSPSIDAEGVRWNLLPDGLLLLEADLGAAWSVVVTAG